MVGMRDWRLPPLSGSLPASGAREKKIGWRRGGGRDDVRQRQGALLMLLASNRRAMRRLPIDVVRAYVHGHNHIPFEIKDGAQIGFDVHGVNGPAVMSGEAVDFMGTQGESNGFSLKIFQARRVDSFWLELRA